MARPGRLQRQVLLELPAAGGRHEKPPRANLSAVALHGQSLFLGTDEGTVLDRLTGSAAESFAAAEIFPLEKVLGLPCTDEIDIEGLDVEGGQLWVIGSHSRTRAQPGAKDPIADLAVLKHNPNRHVLACLDLSEGEGGSTEPPRSPGRGVAQLPLSKKRGTLTKALKADAHLAPFLKLPAKENGFDIEGVAVHGRRLLLGLRGPVLRGIAVVLEIAVEDDGAGGLALRPIGAGGRTWRKHLLDLCGNGIRDLHRVGEDVLILAGPTAAIDGRCAVWRWREPFALGREAFVSGGDRLTRTLSLPVGDDADHPEGFCLLPGGRELLVVYDSPAKARCRGPGGVMADVFELPT